MLSSQRLLTSWKGKVASADKRKLVLQWLRCAALEQDQLMPDHGLILIGPKGRNTRVAAPIASWSPQAGHVKAGRSMFKIRDSNPFAEDAEGPSHP